MSGKNVYSNILGLCGRGVELYSALEGRQGKMGKTYR